VDKLQVSLLVSVLGLLILKIIFLRGAFSNFTHGAWFWHRIRGRGLASGKSIHVPGFRELLVIADSLIWGLGLLR
jgi:hypothetical protein